MQQHLYYVNICIPQFPEGDWTYAVELDQPKLSLGSIVFVSLQKRKAWGVVSKLDVEAQSGVEYKKIEGVLDAYQIPPKPMAFYHWVSQYYLCSLNRVLDTAFPKKTPDIFAVKERERKPKSREIPSFTLPELTESQERATSEYRQSLLDGNRAFLLHGITGSGKTRVMAEWALDVLKKGKMVLWLVPEIALTPQTRMRMESYFGKSVDVVHSALKWSEKRELWRRLAAGKVDVLLGTRSAILFPLENLGAIFVDEEHDSSYKQMDRTPRYQTKDLALMRGSLEKFPVVLASATPSMESSYLVDQGKLRRVFLGERALVNDLPQIRLIDRKLYGKYEGRHLFTSLLREKVQKTVEEGNQVILLHNRRGYATAYSCVSCGWVQECVDCQTVLTWHKKTNRLHCHQCARVYFPVSACPECGARSLEYLGAGIQQSEEELNRLLPDIKVLRLDRDTATTEDKLRGILEGFRRGEADVLLGTQMVVKGHDFPRVQLVGVIDGDRGAQIPDFRASERLFQTLSQVSGRAGRSQGGGEVLIQTWDPQQPVIQFALKNDYSGFAKWEKQQREILQYPPFSRWLMIDISGRWKDAPLEYAHQMCTKLERQSYRKYGCVKGPIQSMLPRFKGQFTFRLILQGPTSKVLSQWYESVPELKKPKKGIQISLDRDPQSIL